MNEPLARYMKVGIIHFMAYPSVSKGEGPILETLRALAQDDYFSVVEVTWIKDPAIRRKARVLMDTAKLVVAYGGQPRLLTTGLNINDLDPMRRRQAVATLKEGIDEAYELGAVGFAFLSGPCGESQKSQAFNALIDSTAELCDYAKARGSLKLIHEIFDCDVDKKSLIGPAVLARQYAEAVRRQYDNFGLMVDLSHLPLVRETPDQALTVLKDFLVHIHIGNCVCRPGCPGYGDQHPRFGFPNGENDVAQLAEFLKVLLRIGYLNDRMPGIVSFEVKPFDDEDPDLVIANAKRTLNQAWAMI